MAILSPRARTSKPQPIFRADGDIFHTHYLGNDDECVFRVYYCEEHIVSSELYRVNGERPGAEHAAYQDEFDDLLADFGDVFQSVMDAIADQ